MKRKRLRQRWNGLWESKTKEKRAADRTWQREKRFTEWTGRRWGGEEVREWGEGGVQVQSVTRAGEWMLVKSNFSRLCKTAVSVCLCVFVFLCVSSLCSHDVKSIYSIYSKKNGDHHWTRISTARRLFFSIFQIYILFVQDGDRRRSKRQTKQSKRGWTLLLLQLFGFLRVFSFFFGGSILPFTPGTKSHPPHLNVPDYKQRNSRDFDPDRQHLSCSWLTFTVSQPSTKKEEKKWGNGEDRWRRRRWEMAAAWRMAEAREEEHHRAPVRPPSKTCPHPSPPLGNVTWRVCVCLCVFICVCGGFEASVWAYGELLAVLVLVIHDAFESQASKVLKDEVIVLGDAAGRRKKI